MALQIHSPSSFTTNKPYHLLLSTPKAKFTTLLIRSQNTPNTEPAQESGPSNKPKPASPGLGFGSSSTSSSSSSSSTTSGEANVSKKKKLKSKRERGSVIRRTPFEKPNLISQEDEAKAKDMMQNEKAFLLAWLGIGGVIFVQGIALSVSGFLPEDVDKFFVKYLYPTFTPTVAFFVAGTVAYGVLKYLQNEKLNEQK
ncbi:hypothetical protein Dsin_014919 [Dipteronia sinensis]|uniref:Protein LOW PSII ACCUMULATION 2, chloroplastic n=1 Tax=Dipteronia sinensis TaxID=43782 RepID=A0AAE0ANZ3_9ROSI|nr:hypothetical protein Dsin_014919 [Dipteronia sinensis]